MRLQTWCGSYVEGRRWWPWALGWARVAVRPWRWRQVARIRRRVRAGTVEGSDVVSLQGRRRREPGPAEQGRPGAA